MVNSGIQPLQNSGLLARVETLGADRTAWASEHITAGLQALETLAAPTSGAFLVGDELTAADLLLVPQLYNARRFGASLDAFPTLLRAENAALALPAVADSHPDHFRTKR